MLFVIAFGSMSATAGRLAVPALLPTIIETFQITAAVAGYAVTATIFGFGIAQYPGGSFSDELSRKTVLVLAAGLFILGFSVMTVSSTFLLLLIGAGVIGIANGLYLPASLAELSKLFTTRRGPAFGINGASIQLGSAIGPGLVIVALALGWWRLAFLPAVGLFVILLVSLHRWNKDEYVFRGVPAFNVRATLRRLAVTDRLRRAMIAFTVFGFVWQGGINFLPTLMQISRGFSPTLASTVFASVFLLSMVANPVAGELGDRFSYPTVATGATLIGLVGLIVLISFNSTVMTIGSCLLFGVGLSSFWPVMDALIMEQLPDNSMGGDFGALNTFNVLAGSLGPVYVGYAAERVGYPAAFLGLAAPLVVVLAVLVVMWRVGE